MHRLRDYLEKNKIKNITVYILFFCVILSSTMLIIQFKGYTAFQIFMVLFCLAMLVATKRICFVNDLNVNLIFAEIVVSSVLAYSYDTTAAYRFSAVYMMIILVPVYFTVAYMISLLDENKKLFDLLRLGIKIFCVIQIIWCTLQYLLQTFFEIDLNQVLFVDTLHMVTQGSWYSPQSKMCLTGLCWHPSIMAPILVLAFLMFNNIWLRAYIIFLASVAESSTVLLGVVSCAGLMLLHKAVSMRKEFVVKKHYIVIISVLAIAALVIAAEWGMFDVVVTKIQVLFERMFKGAEDISTFAHKRYYTAYPDVVNISSLPQILFGYGEGCSGYPYGILFNQYTFLRNWAVESDIMNIIVGRGIFGGILFYTLVARIIILGRRINFKYVALMLAIAIEGVTYNIQFDFVLMIEIILLIATKDGYDIFESEKANTKNQKENHYGRVNVRDNVR